MKSIWETYTELTVADGDEVQSGANVPRGEMKMKPNATMRIESWIPLSERFPKGKESVLLFSPHMHLDLEFPGHPVVVSNPDFARQNATKSGYTHWCPIPYPLPADASMVKDWSNWECRYYWLEEDEPPEPPHRTWKQKLARWLFPLLS